MSEKEALLDGHNDPYYSGLADISQSSRSSDSEVIIRTGTEPEDPRRTGMPIFRAMFVVANAALGAGMLNFPQAYAQAGGIVNALAIQTVGSLILHVSLVVKYFCLDFLSCEYGLSSMVIVEYPGNGHSGLLGTSRIYIILPQKVGPCRFTVDEIKIFVATQSL